MAKRRSGAKCGAWFLAIVVPACTAVVHAQSYPLKPVRLVVGNASGSSDDFHGRSWRRS